MLSDTEILRDWTNIRDVCPSGAELVMVLFLINRIPLSCFVEIVFYVQSWSFFRICGAKDYRALIRKFRRN